MNISKILFTSIFEEGEGGGEGRVAHEMAHWFSKYYQVVMLCPGPITGLTVGEQSFRQFCIKSSGKGNLVMPLLSPENVRKIFNFLNEFKPDIIHIHDPALLGVIVQTWAQLHRVPIFYTAHVLPSRVLDFGASETSRLVSLPINEGLAEHYLLAFYHNCDAVVALNKTTAEANREFGYTGPLAIIPNGRDLSFYHTCKFTDIRKKPFQLTFVGFLSKRKNQTFLLDVMRCLSDGYNLQLIGEAIVPSFLEELERIVAEHKLRVTFTGQLTQADIIKALERTHVFVSASKMEVQSLVVIEALASGTPVVGLSNETVDELVDDSNGVRLSKYASPEEFAGAVERLCSLPVVEYTQLCEGARKRVDHLDWSNVMEQTIQSYELILKEKAKKVEPVNGHEVLTRFLARFPEGTLKNDLKQTLSDIPLPAAPHIPVKPRTIILTVLNMAASEIVYWVLKGPVRFISWVEKNSQKRRRS